MTSPTAVPSLIPGTYRLKHDVANPHPDRRVNQDRISSWEGWVIWPAGLVLVVVPYPESKGAVRIRARGAFRDFAPWDDAFPLLVSAMEPVVESPSDLLRRLEDSAAGACALAILDRLLTTQAVADALAAIQAEELS